jgi:hypothetical protein
MSIVDADVNPADYAKTDPQAIVEATLDHPLLAGGSIIDLHDSAETDDDGLRLARPIPMIEALPKIIDGLQAKGFELVGLDVMELADATRSIRDARNTRGNREPRRSDLIKRALIHPYTEVVFFHLEATNAR